MNEIKKVSSSKTCTLARPKNLGQECPSYLANRRSFLRGSFAFGCGLATTPFLNAVRASEVKTTQSEPSGFFTLARRNDHWWLITPEGKPFFTMGLNHIDPASLRYPENIDIWRKKYGGSTIRWIKESVAPNLKAWGFNTVGWVQEVTVKPSGSIRVPSRSTNIARSTCHIATCSRSPNRISGRSIPSTTISAATIGRNGSTMSRDHTALNWPMKETSSAISTATVRHGLTTGQTTNGAVRSSIPSD